MIEFPEVLNEEGTFEGFDVIVGNPPYISLEKLRRDTSVYAQMHRTDEVEIPDRKHTIRLSLVATFILFC